METFRWYVTILIFRLLHVIGLERVAERFAVVTGLRQALRRLLWRMGEGT